MPKTQPTPETTRQALIRAGLELFGEAGFEAASTRQIAQLAGANISAISYYFGGKDKLRLACAEYVAEKLVGAVNMRLPGQTGLSPEDAAQLLEATLSGICKVLLRRPDAREISQFVLREMVRPGVVLDTIFPQFFEPVHKSACALWATATGQDADSETVRLSVFSLLGQVVYFRIGQALVCKRMGWRDVGPDQASAIEDIIRGNLRAMLSDARKGPVR